MTNGAAVPPTAYQMSPLFHLCSTNARTPRCFVLSLVSPLWMFLRGCSSLHRHTRIGTLSLCFFLMIFMFLFTFYFFFLAVLLVSFSLGTSSSSSTLHFSHRKFPLALCTYGFPCCLLHNHPKGTHLPLFHLLFYCFTRPETQTNVEKKGNK